VFGVWKFSGAWCLVLGVFAFALNSKTQRTLSLLREYESRNITFIESDGLWPIVWERARGVHVWDADGRKYLDLTGAFGVAAAGHGNPRVVQAGQKQMGTLLHAMGDVHPHALKAKLAAELSGLTFGRWWKAEGSTSKVQGPRSKVGRGHAIGHGKVIFCNSGFEAVEAALKTAVLATDKRGVIAFERAYHGLGYGALNATHREHFRAQFRSQLGGFGHFVPFPSDEGVLAEVESRVQSLLREHPIGAVLVEPIQARGGIHIPPAGFLPMLRRMCDVHGALLILDEIYTGFGRTGAWFACEHSGVMPDIICLGKALTGGFPLSACVGRADVMDAAWPATTGEAIHTSTFLGHPVGCAMALANIAEIRRLKLAQRSARAGALLKRELFKVQGSKSKVRCVARGIGLMAGLELMNADGSPATDVSLRTIKSLLHRGFIFLPEGEHANVIGFTPPLTISDGQIKSAVTALGEEIGALESDRVG
jgi:4-aminobutyrate aminotransferase-like enzyme